MRERKNKIDNEIMKKKTVKKKWKEKMKKRKRK